MGIYLSMLRSWGASLVITYFFIFQSWEGSFQETFLSIHESWEASLLGTFLVRTYSSMLQSLGTSLVGTYLSMLQSWGESLVATYMRKHARVAKLKICHDSACSFPTEPHLAVDLVDVPLHRNNATAISYAWGEFDRQKRLVGHTFRAEEHVQLELGTEWVVSDVVDRLAELSAEKPIWMDQLCIPQEEDKVLKTLADMPSIFSKLDVVALLPGSLCGCVPKLVEKLNQLPKHGDRKKDGLQALMCIEQEDRCLSSGAFSWNRRMWTYHELMHSQRVRCVWASKIENPCVKLHYPDANLENLPPFQRRMFEMITERGYPQDAALAFIYKYLRKTVRTMSIDLFVYCRTAGGHDGQMIEQFYHFLLGKQMVKLKHNQLARSKSGSILNFLFQLSTRLGEMDDSSRTRREATKPRDYIISVWTSCPDYIVPNEYKSMSAARLMQDALNQLQRNHRITLAVTAPHGLFDADLLGSALWKPVEYLSAIDPSSDIALYRTIADEGIAFKVFPVLRSSIPILFNDTAQPSLSTSAMDYKMLVNYLHVAFPHKKGSSGYLTNGTIARMVIKLLHRIMSHWTDDRVGGVQYTLERAVHEWIMKPTDMRSLQSLQRGVAAVSWLCRIFPIRDYMKFLCNHRKTDAFDEGYAQELNFLVGSHKPERIHDAVYNVVAAALELDLEYCEKKNVQLIFSSIANDERRPPRVGFCRGDVDIEDIASRKRKTITVSIGKSKSTLLYEAVHIDSESKKLGRPAYQVFAVWVPTESISDDEFGASTRWMDDYFPRKNVGVLV